MKNLFKILLTAFIVLSCNESSTDPVIIEGGVPVFDIRIDQESYTALLSNKISDFETNCEFSFKGVLYTAKISASGAGSRLLDKWSYKIELNNGQTIDGLNEFNLSAQAYDHSSMHSVLASHIYRQLGFPVFKSQHVFVRINGKDKGLYPMLERVEDEFFSDRNLKVTELIKVGFNSQFTFDEKYNPQFFYEKKIPKDNNFNSLFELIHACDTVQSFLISNSLTNFINLENYILYHAATSLINNADGFTNNFYLWKENQTNPFKVIPWDFDKAFYDSPEGRIAGYNQIAKKLFTNSYYLNEYKRILLALNENLLTESNLFPIIDSTAAVIDEAYKKDSYLGLAGKNLDYEVQKLKNYIVQRHKFIKEKTEEFYGL